MERSWKIVRHRKPHCSYSASDCSIFLWLWFIVLTYEEYSPPGRVHRSPKPGDRRQDLRKNAKYLARLLQKKSWINQKQSVPPPRIFDNVFWRQKKRWSSGVKVTFQTLKAMLFMIGRANTWYIQVKDSFFSSLPLRKISTFELDFSVLGVSVHTCSIAYLLTSLKNLVKLRIWHTRPV